MYGICCSEKQYTCTTVWRFNGLQYPFSGKYINIAFEVILYFWFKKKCSKM